METKSIGRGLNFIWRHVTFAERKALVAKIEELEARWDATKALEAEYKRHPVRHDRVGLHLKELMESAGVTEGKVLEIGGRKNPFSAELPNFEYINLDLGDSSPGVLKGDITSCPEIASESFDAIISMDVFEHIAKPWLAGSEITRLLRPGGFTYHSTLFSWRYHPCPIDYWRFSPEGLASLFPMLEEVATGFDDLERRRNIIGTGRVTSPVDAFGGWRENWRVFYAGKKPV